MSCTEREYALELVKQWYDFLEEGCHSELSSDEYRLVMQEYTKDAQYISSILGSGAFHKYAMSQSHWCVPPTEPTVVPCKGCGVMCNVSFLTNGYCRKKGCVAKATGSKAGQ